MSEWAQCAECGDTGWMNDLAPCTTFDGDCACNGPMIAVPCRACDAYRKRLEEVAREVVRIWHEPARIDSALDLDSAIDELAQVLCAGSVPGSPTQRGAA